MTKDEYLANVATNDTSQERVYKTSKSVHEPVALVYDPITGSITPLQRTWVGLTDEEIQYCVELKNPEAIAEEVEAKLKEKNT